MGFRISGYTGTDAEVESTSRGQRVVPVARGLGYTTANVTGTIAAALAVNSSVFVMRLDPGSAVRAYMERIRLEWTTIVAFTTPVTAGRRLGLFRGSGAAASGGTAIATAQKKHTTSALSEFDTASGGDMRIATTGALTVAGITYETEPFILMSLTHVGAAGGFREEVYEFTPSAASPLVLEPGQLLGVRNPVIMDAAGTWQLNVTVNWHEAAVLA